MSNIDILLFTAIPADYGVLMASKQLLVDEIQVLALANQVLIETILLNRIQTAQSITLQNNTISTTETFEQNTKTVNTIYLNY